MASPSSSAARAASRNRGRLGRIQALLREKGRPGRARALTTPGRAATQIQETVRAALQDVLKESGVSIQDFEGNVELYLADSRFAAALKANVERRAERTGQQVSDAQLVQAIQPEELKAAVARIREYMADNTASLPDGEKRALDNPRRQVQSERSAPQPTRPGRTEAIRRHLAEKEARERSDAAQVRTERPKPKVTMGPVSVVRPAGGKARPLTAEEALELQTRPESAGGKPGDFNDMPQPGRPTEEVSGAIPEGSAPLDPELRDLQASEVNSRFPNRQDGPEPGDPGRAAGQVIFPADDRPRDPDTDNLRGPRKGEPAQIRTTRDPGPTDQYRVIADGTLNNMRVVSEESGETVAGDLARLGEGRFLFRDGDGRVFLFEDVTQGPRELSELDLRLLSREPGFAPEPVAGARSFAPEEVISDDALTAMVAELGPFSSPGQFPPSLNLQTFSKTLDEIDLLAATDSAKLQEILGRVFADPEDAATALFNARSLRDELLKDPRMLQMVDGKAVNLSAESPGGSVPPTEIVGRAPGGAQTVTVEGRSYVLDDAGYADLNRLKADTQKELSAIEILLPDALGLANLPPTGVETRFAIDFSDPFLMARLEREGGPLGEAVESLKEAVSLGRPTQANEVARSLIERRSELRIRDAQIDRAFMGPGETGEALEDFGPGQRPLGSKVAVNPDGSIERLDGRDPRDGRPTIEILSNPNAPDDSMLSTQARDAARPSTMPPAVSNIRTLIRQAFQSRNVPPPPVLARVLETRARGSRTPPQKQLQAVGAQLEAVEQRLRGALTGKERAALLREQKRLQRRAARIADTSGSDTASASVAAEQGARSEQGWNGSVEDFIEKQLGVDASAEGGKRSDAFSRLDPSSPLPEDATPQEVAARQAIAEAFPGDAPLGSALEAISTGRTRPELLNRREAAAGRADTLRSRIDNLPKEPGLLARLSEGIARQFGPGGLMAPPGMTRVADDFSASKPRAGERIRDIRGRLQARLGKAEAASADANQPLVSPQRIEEGIERNATRVRSIPNQPVAPIVNELGDTGMTEDAALSLDQRKRLTEEELSQLDAGPFTGDENAEPVGIGPKGPPRPGRVPDNILRIGDEVDRLREVAGDTQAFADLEYVWNESLGGGDRKKARVSSPEDVRAALEDADRLIAEIDAQLEGSGQPPLGAYGNETANSLQLADGASYEGAEPIEPDRLFFETEADANIAAAALRGEVPAFEPGDARWAMEERGFAPDFREGRTASAEFFEKEDGSVAMRIGVPVKETRGSTAPRTLFLELPAMAPGRVMAKSKGRTDLFELSTGDGSIKKRTYDRDKIEARRQKSALAGSMFGMPLDTTGFRGQSAQTPPAPQSPAQNIPNLRAQLEGRIDPELERRAALQADETAFFEDELELQPGDQLDPAARPTEPLETPVPRQADGEPDYTYEGTPFATDEEFYDNAPANRLSESEQTPDRLRRLRESPPEADSPQQVPGGQSRAARRIARLGAVAAAGAIPFLSGAASKEQTGMDQRQPLDPAEYAPVADINAGEPVREPTARERIANRLAELRGATSRRRPLRYGTTQLYTPNWN